MLASAFGDHCQGSQPNVEASASLMMNMQARIFMSSAVNTFITNHSTLSFWNRRLFYVCLLEVELELGVGLCTWSPSTNKGFKSSRETVQLGRGSNGKCACNCVASWVWLRHVLSALQGSTIATRFKDNSHTNSSVCARHSDELCI